MQEREAFQEETASPEEAACYQWEEEGTEVSVGEEVPSAVACLRVAAWAACCGRRVDVQMGDVAGAPSSSQKEAAVA